MEIHLNVQSDSVRYEWKHIHYSIMELQSSCNGLLTIFGLKRLESKE